MPIYEYKCRDCGLLFERLQKVSDPPVQECERCSGPVDKVVSQTAFQFKGTGWYVTDYAKKGSSPSEKTASGDKGDAKPDAKPDTASGGSTSSSTAEANPAAAPATASKSD